MFSNNKNKLNKESGFGIIEVVITLFIIGVTLLLFAVVSQSVVLNKYNRYKEIALRIADTQVQDLRLTPYSELPSSGSFSHSQLADLPQGAGTMTITEIDDGYSDISVTVSWRNPNDTQDQQITLSTKVWQYGLGK